MASRIAARSTMAGTPVKSCIRTRAGTKAISRVPADPGAHRARASTSSCVTVAPSSWRSRFSRSTFTEKGRRLTSAIDVESVEPDDLEGRSTRRRAGRGPRSCLTTWSAQSRAGVSWCGAGGPPRVDMRARERRSVHASEALRHRERFCHFEPPGCGTSEILPQFI